MKVLNIVTVWLSLVLSVCAQAAGTRAEFLRETFDSQDTNYVFVVAHRSDWRNHPENSLPAIRSAIAMGCDMVEIDVARTKDGVHVLSHDGKLDRVSDRKGAIADLTLAEVRQARLRQGQGGPHAALTDERVPTLEEALEACRGKILVNVDKFNGDPEGITAIISRLGVERQVVLKGYGDYAFISGKTGAPWRFVEERKFVYMPIVDAGRTSAKLAATRAHVAGWMATPYPPPAFEVCIPGDAPVETLFADLRRDPRHPRLWVNTLWDSLAHGHSESLQGKDFSEDRVWGWCLDLGATLIQTDRPAELVDYLKRKGRRVPQTPAACTHASTGRSAS